MNKCTLQGYLTMLLLLVSTAIYSQEKAAASPEQNADKLTQWMKSNLQLANNQVDHVRAINLKYAYKLNDLQNSPDTKQQKLRALKVDGEAKDQEMKRVLTGEQFQTWLSKKDEAKMIVNENIKRKKGA